MKILASAQITGAVTQVSPADGTLQLAGLHIQMEHGAVVRAGDFVEVDARLNSSGEWTGRIKAHYLAAAADAGGEDVAINPDQKAQDRPVQAQGSGAPSPAQPTTESGPASRTPEATPASSAPAPSAGTRSTGGSRAGRYGSRPSAAGQASGSAQGPSQGQTRPPFNPSSADRAVSF